MAVSKEAFTTDVYLYNEYGSTNLGFLLQIESIHFLKLALLHQWSAWTLKRSEKGPTY